MGDPSEHSDLSLRCAANFRTTHWSIVLQAGEENSLVAAEALETLCRTYWYPLYAYIRRKGHTPEHAQDLTQEFFVRLLRLNSLREVAREKGKFRSFLLASLNHFLSDARDKAHALKRGGGHAVLSLDDENAEQRYAADLCTQSTPEKVFDRQWALTVLNSAFTRLETEYSGDGKGGQFDELKTFLSNEVTPGTYDALALKLDMTPRAVSMAVHRLRQRYAELVRAEVTNTVAGPGDVEEELNYVFEAAGQ